MLKGLTATKTADKMIWSDGVLTYTIVVSNNTDYDYVGPVVTDILDISLISLVDDSVTVDGVKISTPQYTWDSSSGKLSISLTDIEAKGLKTITFQV